MSYPYFPQHMGNYGPWVAPHIPAPPAHRPLACADVQLVVKQQPKEALVTVESKERNRKPIDPPPIIQLHVEPRADPNQHFLQSPYLFMQCRLVSDKDQTTIKGPGGKAVISGSLVSSLHRLKDTENNDGGYFVFGDISCKVVGRHRLEFSLYDMHKETRDVQLLATVISEPFSVVAQKDFHGLEESTYLSRAFSDQGVRLRLRKEPRAFGGGQKRNYNTYSNGMNARQESMRSPQDAGFYGDPPSSPAGKRSRFSDDNGTAQQHPYSSSSHQPVRTPESANPTFAANTSFNTPITNQHTGFDYRSPLGIHNGSFDGTSTGNNGPYSPAFSQAPQNYGYGSRNGIFEQPHQPHGLTAGYSNGSAQQGMRGDHEAAASLHSLAVQSHHSSMSGQSAGYMGELLSDDVDDTKYDPALSDPILQIPPKSHYQEKVDEELRGLQTLQSSRDDGDANQPYLSEALYHNSLPSMPLRQYVSHDGAPSS